MSTVSVTIDHINVSVPSETTILQAAKSAGINIPTLCAWVDAGHTPGAAGSVQWKWKACQPWLHPVSIPSGKAWW